MGAQSFTFDSPGKWTVMPLAAMGATLGQTARNTLQEYVEMDRPLSASVVSKLNTFADKVSKPIVSTVYRDLVKDVKGRDNQQGR